jgi:hypothetical protein
MKKGDWLEVKTGPYEGKKTTIENISKEDV